MSAICGKPKDLRAYPPDPKDQGRLMRTGMAEDTILFFDAAFL